MLLAGVRKAVGRLGALYIRPLLHKTGVGGFPCYTRLTEKQQGDPAGSHVAGIKMKEALD